MKLINGWNIESGLISTGEWEPIIFVNYFGVNFIKINKVILYRSMIKY